MLSPRCPKTDGKCLKIALNRSQNRSKVAQEYQHPSNLSEMWNFGGQLLHDFVSDFDACMGTHLNVVNMLDVDPHAPT